MGGVWWRVCPRAEGEGGGGGGGCRKASWATSWCFAPVAPALLGLPPPSDVTALPSCVSGSPGGGITRRDSDSASVGWDLLFSKRVGYSIDWP